METNRRQLALLTAIVAVMIAVLWWQYAGDGVPAAATTAAAVPPAPPAAAVPARGGTGPAAGNRTVPDVRLSVLGQESAEPVDTGRDPFRFGAPRDTGTGPGASGGPATGPAGSGPAAPAGPAVPAGPPPPPPILLKYIGLAQQGVNGRTIAVLRDERGIYYGREGDVIEGRYRLLRVTADAVEVAYVDGRGRRMIQLTGGQP
ncbi:MAG: hypothetical protein NTY02_15230 [Acidobacteria bacterium]|nr:hypothetical protein [Acidobacteriota bacterium]